MQTIAEVQGNFIKNNKNIPLYNDYLNLNIVYDTVQKYSTK